MPKRTSLHTKVKMRHAFGCVTYCLYMYVTKGVSL